MDSQYSYTSSSSSSSGESYPFAVYQQQEIKRQKSYVSSLHKVRRVSKPMTKQPIAPMPPTPRKIYTVLPIHFKETVQMLTSEPGIRSAGRLQAVAPPPLVVVPPTAVLPAGSSDDDNGVSEWERFLCRSNDDVVRVADALSDRRVVNNHETSGDVFGGFNDGPVGFAAPAPLSPSSLAWWASVLPSPGTLSSQLEAS